jgi:hypothetical protein
MLLFHSVFDTPTLRISILFTNLAAGKRELKVTVRAATWRRATLVKFKPKPCLQQASLQTLQT